MPLYRFYCKKCDKEYKKFAKYGEEIFCEYCGEKLERLLPQSWGISFKGKGFYKTSGKGKE